MQILTAAQGVTGDGKRAAPSAGGVMPLQLQVAVGSVCGRDIGVYTFDPEAEKLNLVELGDTRPVLAAAAIGDQPWVASAAVVVAVCGDGLKLAEAFVTQPPYGQRSARYIAIEAGAVAQNLHLTATEMGLGGVLVGGYDDAEVARVFGLVPPLEPVLLFCVGAVEEAE